MLRITMAVIAVGLCCLTTSCYDTQTPDQTIAVDVDCNLINMIRGEKVEALSVKNNDLVKWVNNTDHVVKIIVTDPNVLSGRNSMRLSPGEFAIVRVASGKLNSILEWICDTDPDGDDGDGGGNTPVNNGGGGSGGGGSP